MSVQHVHNSPSEDLESSHIDDDEYGSNSNSGKYSSSNRYDNDRNNRNSNMTVPSYNGGDRNINASVPRSSSSSAQSKNRNSQHNNNNNNNSNEIKSNTISRLISKSKSVESNISIPSPHFICPILNDDDDTSDDPWVNLSACLPFVIPYLLSVLKVSKKTVGGRID